MLLFKITSIIFSINKYIISSLKPTHFGVGFSLRGIVDDKVYHVDKLLANNILDLYKASLFDYNLIK